MVWLGHVSPNRPGRAMRPRQWGQSSSQQHGGRDGCETSLRRPARCSSYGTEGARTEPSHGGQSGLGGRLLSFAQQRCCAKRSLAESLQSKSCLSFPVGVTQLTLTSLRAAVKPLVPSQGNEITLGELLGGLKRPGHAWPGSAQPQHFPPKEETQRWTWWLCGSERLPRVCIYPCCGREAFAAGG